MDYSEIIYTHSSITTYIEMTHVLTPISFNSRKLFMLFLYSEIEQSVENLSTNILKIRTPLNLTDLYNKLVRATGTPPNHRVP